MITESQLLKIAPGAKMLLVPDIVKWINFYADRFGVNTPARMNAFIAQAAHETDGFKTLEEYASGSAYEGRKDLGNTKPGDGVRFKGRGIFQTTGRANYQQASQKIFKDDRLLSNPELLKVPHYAVLSAFIFWDTRKLNSLADLGDFRAITKKINGGYNGLQSRVNFWERAKQVILETPIFPMLLFVIFVISLLYIL